MESASVLRAGLSRQDAADTVWAVNSTEVYQLMTETHGWNPQHYQQWLTETLCKLLTWHAAVSVLITGVARNRGFRTLGTA